MPRIIILGTGTDVGKTYVSRCLATALATHPTTGSVVALKPIETGVTPNNATASPVNSDNAPSAHRSSQSNNSTPAPIHRHTGPRPHCANSPPSDLRRRPSSDAQLLAVASHPPFSVPPHAYAFREPVSPHLAARNAGQSIDPTHAVAWISLTAQGLIEQHYHTLHRNHDDHPTASGLLDWTLIETAGAVFTPLAKMVTNLTLAQSLEPSIWILVAPDRVGVLHDLSATLLAMSHFGRKPDSIVLSEPAEPDASTGTNAKELRSLEITEVDATIPRGASLPAPILRKLIELARSRGL